MDVEMKTRLWMPKENERLRTPNWNAKWRIDLGVKLKTNNGSERHTESMALNAKLNWIPMNVKLRRTTLNVKIENDMVALNAELQGNDGGKYASV